jgi:uncharacterized damage-inducible protein DinB
MDLNTFELLARYNIWATKRLNQVLETVSDEDFMSDSGLYFNSIFGTLNHLLVGEHYLWFPRFSGQQSPRVKLNAIVENDRKLLLEKLHNNGYHWISFLKDVDVTVFSQNLHYQTSTGKQMRLPYAPTLLHVFNHGTHHRGQITTALTSLGYACPELDMVYMLVEEQNQQAATA